MHPETGAFLQFVHIDLKEYFMLNLNKQKDNRDCWKITARRFLRSRMNQMREENIMQYARKLRKGDRVAIVSLSSGMLGEPFCSHNIEIGTGRLRAYGLEPVFMPNALKGIE